MFNKKILMICFLSSLSFSDDLKLPGLEDVDLTMGQSSNSKLINSMEKEKPINIKPYLRIGYSFEKEGLFINKKNNKEEKLKIKIYSSSLEDNKIAREITLTNVENNITSSDIIDIVSDVKLNILNFTDTSFVNGSLNRSVSCKLDSIPFKIPIKVVPGYKTPMATLLCDDGTSIQNIIKLDYAVGNSHYIIKETKIISPNNILKINLKFKLVDGVIEDVEYLFEDKDSKVISK